MALGLIRLGLVAAVARGFSTAPRAAPAQRLRATNDQQAALADLQRRVEAVENELAATRRARLDALEAELASLRQGRIRALEAELASLRGREKVPQTRESAEEAVDKSVAAATKIRTSIAEETAIDSSGTVVTPIRAAMMARAALGSVQALSGKNDEFVDDDLEDLLEIGGDPTFLEQARDTPRRARNKKPDFEWDGVIDETAYFDDL